MVGLLCAVSVRLRTCPVLLYVWSMGYVEQTPTYRLSKRPRASSLSRSRLKQEALQALGNEFKRRLLAQTVQRPQATLNNHDDSRDVSQLKGVIGRFRPCKAQGTWHYHQTWTRALTNNRGDQQALDLWRFYDSYQFVTPQNSSGVSQAPYNTDSWFALDPFRAPNSVIGDGVGVSDNPTTVTEQTNQEILGPLASSTRAALDQKLFLSHVVNEMQFENKSSVPMQVDVLWFAVKKDVRRTPTQLWNDCTALDSAGEVNAAGPPVRTSVAPTVFNVQEGRPFVQTYGTSPMMYQSFNRYYSIAKRYRFLLGGGSIKKINTTLYVSRMVSRKYLQEKNQDTQTVMGMRGITYDVLVIMRPMVATETNTTATPTPFPAIPSLTLNVFGWNRHTFKSVQPRGAFSYQRVAMGNPVLDTAFKVEHIDDDGDVQNLSVIA